MSRMAKRFTRTAAEDPIIAIAIIGILFSSFLIGSIFFSAYTSGWEIGTAFERASLNGVAVDSTTVDSSTFTDLSYVTSRGGRVKLYDWNYDYPQWEQYEQWFGSTGVQLTVDNPYPVLRDAYGEDWYKTPDGVPYRTYTKSDTNDTLYFYDHYVYQYTVDIETDGLAERIGAGVYGTCENLLYGINGPNTREHEVQVRLWSEFALQPWAIEEGQILTEGNVTAQVTDAFYGVMSASVSAVEVGNVDVIDAQYNAIWNGLADPHYDHAGAALPMIRSDTGGGYSSIGVEPSEDDVKTVPNTIPKSVLIEVGADLEPGILADKIWTLENPDYFASFDVINKYVRYVIRVDAVYTAGLVFITGDQDEGGDKNEDGIGDSVETIWETLGAGIRDAGAWLSGLITGPLVIIAVIVVSVLFVVIFIRILPRRDNRIKQR